jgi:hypothetical protein
MYVLGCKLSRFRLCDSDFGITPVDDITIGITCTALCFHIAHISWARRCLLLLLLLLYCHRRRVVVVVVVVVVEIYTNLNL